MIDKICNFLTNKIRKAMPEVDDERAEVINFGLQNIVGETPKIFIMFGVAWILGIFELALFTVLTLLIYRGASGGFHAKTHMGCIIITCLLYCGIPFISRYFVMSNIVKNIAIGFIWIFGVIMIKLYAPADTENVPILNKKDRRKKQIVAYISFTIGLIVAYIVKDNTISNILILSNFIQTLTITKWAYKITKNKYGYEVYETSNNMI